MLNLCVTSHVQWVSRWTTILNLRHSCSNNPKHNNQDVYFLISFYKHRANVLILKCMTWPSLCHASALWDCANMCGAHTYKPRCYVYMELHYLSYYTMIIPTLEQRQAKELSTIQFVSAKRDLCGNPLIYELIKLNCSTGRIKWLRNWMFYFVLGFVSSGL